MLLHHCVTVILCHCGTVLLHHCLTVILCYCGTVLLHYYVTYGYLVFTELSKSVSETDRERFQYLDSDPAMLGPSENIFKK